MMRLQCLQVREQLNTVSGIARLFVVRKHKKKIMKEPLFLSQSKVGNSLWNIINRRFSGRQIDKIFCDYDENVYLMV